MTKKNFEALLEQCNNRKVLILESLNVFAQKLIDRERDPMYNLQWSEETFSNAAKLQVIEEVIYAAGYYSNAVGLGTDEERWEIFTRWLTNKAIEVGASGGSYSTMQTMNLINFYEKRWWAIIARHPDIPSFSW